MRKLYLSYATVLTAVRSFAERRDICEIVPAPTALRFEYEPDRTYFLGPPERPTLVLPTSNTYQKQIAAASVGRVYCLATCYRNEPRTADQATSLHAFHQIEFELCGYTLENIRDFAVELLAHVASEFTAAGRGPGRGPVAGRSRADVRIVDLRELPDPPPADRFDDWSAALESYPGLTVLQHTPQGESPRVNKELPGTTLSRSYDVLLPDGFGEVLSGGERDLRQLHRYFAAEPDRVPSDELVMSGFGIGLERLLAWLLDERDLTSIRPPHIERRIGHEFHP